LIISFVTSIHQIIIVQSEHANVSFVSGINSEENFLIQASITLVILKVSVQNKKVSSIFEGSLSVTKKLLSIEELTLTKSLLVGQKIAYHIASIIDDFPLPFFQNIKEKSSRKMISSSLNLRKFKSFSDTNFIFFNLYYQLNIFLQCHHKSIYYPLPLQFFLYLSQFVLKLLLL
jgi:hypothetical protein